jgi:hypothetical protein
MGRLGNFGGSFHHDKRTGSGLSHQVLPFSHFTVSGKTGETVRVPITALYRSTNGIQNGILIQAIGSAAITVSVTLADMDLAMAPEQTDIWVSPLAITAASNLVLLPTMASALKVEFTAPGVIYLAGT